MAQPWLIRSEMQPAFDGGFIQARFLIGGIFVVKNKAQRNAIHVLNRKLDATTTTLVVVSDENRIYRLKTNPTSLFTSDSDWEVFFVGSTSSFRPVGQWDADNDVLVLLDSDALNRNGEFYFVSDAPTQRTVQYDTLFGGQPVDVVNGDLVVSVGDKWTIITSTVQWEALSKPSVIDDYVNGIVIDHTHVMADITDLAAALDDKYDVGDTAPHNVAFATVSDKAIVEVEFLRQFYYTIDETNDLVSSLTGFTDELAQDSIGFILTDTNSVNFTYNDSTPFIIADVRVARGLSIGVDGVGLGGTTVADITIDGIGYDLNLEFTTITGGNNNNTNTGSYTFAFGSSLTNKGSFGTAVFGEGSEADTGVGSGLLVGEGVYADTYGAIALGRGVKSSGSYSFAGGYFVEGGIGGGYYGKTNTKAPLVDGTGSFGWFATDASQTAGHGVLANYSAAVGGINPNIPSTSPRSFIGGGNGIKARASDPDQAYFPNINIMGTMLNDDTLDRILVVNPTTGQVKWRYAATIEGTGIGVTDGDKGDIIVTGTGTIWNIDPTVTLDNKIYKLRTSASALSSPADGYTYYDTVENDHRTYIDGTWTNLTRPAYFTTAATTFTLTEAHRNAYIYFSASTLVTVTLPTTLNDGFSANLVVTGTGGITLTTPGSYEAIGGETDVLTQYTGITVYLKPGGIWTAYGALGNAGIILTNGSGTTGNGSAIDLGGLLTADTFITGGGTHDLYLGSNASKIQYMNHYSKYYQYFNTNDGTYSSEVYLGDSGQNAFYINGASGSSAAMLMRTQGVGNANFQLLEVNATTTGIYDLLELYKGYSSGNNHTNNIGIGIKFGMHSTTGSNSSYGRLAYRNTNAVAASLTGEFIFRVPVTAVETDIITIKGTGAEYFVDNSAANSANPRWIPDKAYVDATAGSAYTNEMAQDTIAALIQNGSGISWVYNDGSNSLKANLGGTITTTPTIDLASFTLHVDNGEVSFGGNTPLTTFSVVTENAGGSLLFDQNTAIDVTYNYFTQIENLIDNVDNFSYTEMSAGVYEKAGGATRMNATIFAKSDITTAEATLSVNTNGIGGVQNKVQVTDGGINIASSDFTTVVSTDFTVSAINISLTGSSDFALLSDNQILSQVGSNQVKIQPTLLTLGEVGGAYISLDLDTAGTVFIQSNEDLNMNGRQVHLLSAAGATNIYAVGGLLNLKSDTGVNITDGTASVIFSTDLIDIFLPALPYEGGATYVMTFDADGDQHIGYVEMPSGGAGISNTTANNELMKSNGTNAVPSGLFSTTAGNITLGTGLAGSTRTITATGSATDVSLFITNKGAGAIIVEEAGLSAFLQVGAGAKAQLASKSTGFIDITGDVMSFNNDNNEFLFGATSNAATLQTIKAEGSGSNVGLKVKTKGTGDFTIDRGTGKIILAQRPANDNSVVDLLGRDNSTGEVKYMSSATVNSDTIPITFAGGGSVLTTGTKLFYVAQYNFTINGWTMLGGPGQTGSITLDVWKDTYANFPPTVADTMITTGTKPAISATTKNHVLSSLNWAVTTVTAGDILAFNIDSISTFTMVQFFLHITKT